MKMVVAIAAGGDSAEEEISLLSAETVYESLDRSKFEPILVVMRHGVWKARLNDEEFDINKNDFSFQFDGNTIKFDYVFIAIHGTPGEDGKLQAYFDLLQLPYSSPNHIGSTLTFNKWYCNTLLNQLGYKTAKSIYYRKGDHANEDQVVEELGLPCFVKPCSCGSSYGITKVKTKDQLSLTLTKAFEYDVEVMVESYLPGKEVTCGVYQKNGEVIALPITQIIPKGEFFDFEAKYKGNSMEITPARISDEATINIQQLSREVYKKLDMRGIIRVDFMLVDDSIPYIIEVNAVPGMSKASLVPQQVAAHGISLRSFFSEIIEETKI